MMQLCDVNAFYIYTRVSRLMTLADSQYSCVASALATGGWPVRLVVARDAGDT